MCICSIYKYNWIFQKHDVMSHVNQTCTFIFHLSLICSCTHCIQKEGSLIIMDKCWYQDEETKKRWNLYSKDEEKNILLLHFRFYRDKSFINVFLKISSSRKYNFPTVEWMVSCESDFIEIPTWRHSGTTHDSSMISLKLPSN